MTARVLQLRAQGLSTRRRASSFVRESPPRTGSETSTSAGSGRGDRKDPRPGADPRRQLHRQSNQRPAQALQTPAHRARTSPTGREGLVHDESLLSVGGAHPWWSLGIFALCLSILHGLVGGAPRRRHNRSRVMLESLPTCRLSSTRRSLPNLAPRAHLRFPDPGTRNGREVGREARRGARLRICADEFPRRGASLPACLAGCLSTIARFAMRGSPHRRLNRPGRPRPQVPVLRTGGQPEPPRRSPARIFERHARAARRAAGSRAAAIRRQISHTIAQPRWQGSCSRFS